MLLSFAWSQWARILPYRQCVGCFNAKPSIHAIMKRASVYFEEDLHKALKLKAAEASSSGSDLVNKAIRDSLAEDLDDLQAFRDRETEPSVDFESFLKGLKSNIDITQEGKFIFSSTSSCSFELLRGQKRRSPYHHQCQSVFICD